MLGRFGSHSGQVWLLEALYALPEVRLPNHAIVSAVHQAGKSPAIWYSDSQQQLRADGYPVVFSDN